MEYCREAQKYAKEKQIIENAKFNILTYAPFIEYSNYYNLTPDEDAYLTRLSNELEESFNNKL